MADLNEFLKKLGIASPSYDNSPMDPLAPDSAPINTYVDPNETAAPADVDSEPSPMGHQPVRLASDSDIQKIHDIPLPEAQRSVASTAPSVPDALPAQTPVAPPAPETKLSKYQNLLNNYNSNNRNLGMLQGGDQIAQAIASGYGGKIGDGSEAVKSLQTMNRNPLDQLAEADSAQATDPNSDVSKFSREQAAKVMSMRNGQVDPELLSKYQNQFSGMTAAQLEKLGFKGANAGMISPYQQMMIDVAKGKLENQKQFLAQGADRLDLSKTKIGNTQDTVLSKEGQNLGKAIDSMDKTTRNGFGKAAASLMASTELETLIKAKPIEKLDSRDMEEVARIVNNMLTGGNVSAASSIQALVPATYVGDFAHFMEKIKNEPQSVDAQEFVKNYAKLAQKQKTKSMTDIDAIMKSRLPEFYRFKKEKPEEFNAIVNAKIGALNTISTAPETSQTALPEIKPYDGTADSGGIKRKTDTTDLVTVKGPSGQTVKMTKENAAKYLGKPGYEEVK